MFKRHELNYTRDIPCMDISENCQLFPAGSIFFMVGIDRDQRKKVNRLGESKTVWNTLF